jgi:hypothetical protein
VSDDLESAPEAETAEETSASVPDAPPPWGDDFNPERAWQTITHLRGREKELESESKRLKALQEDEDALREFLAEKGFEIAEDESEDEPADEDDVDPVEERLRKIEEAEQTRAERERSDAARQFKSEFDSHVNELAEGAGWELDDDDRLVIWAKSSADNNGVPTVQGTEKAVKEFIDRQEQRVQARLESYKTSKKTAAVVPPGKSASQVPDLSDESARHEWMRQQVANRAQ